jgi:DNA-binding NtrC family response regulator
VNSVVLFVSPSDRDARSLSSMLADSSMELVHAVGLRTAAERLKSRLFPVVLTEAHLEDGTWLDVLHLARPAKAELVVTDPWADARFWAEAINMGAYDLLVQPFQPIEVQRVLASAASARSSMAAQLRVGAAVS